MRRLTKLPDESLRRGLMEVTPDQVFEFILEQSGLSYTIIMSKTRKKEIIIWRQLAMYFMTINEETYFSRISLYFMQNHASAINSRNQIESWIISNRDMKLLVIKLAQHLNRKLHPEPAQMTA